MTHTTTFSGGLGVTLSYSSALTSPTYTALAQIVNVDGPDWSFGIVELPSIANTFKRRRSTLPDGGTVSGQLYLDAQDAGHTVLYGLMASGAKYSWKITLADTKGSGAVETTITFQGFLSKFKPGGMEEEGTLTADFQIDLDSTVTITAGTDGT